MFIETKIIIFIVNVLAFAIPVAFFEIFVEKNGGWGATFSKEKWYGKIIGKNSLLIKLLVQIIGVPYLFGYAIFMYFFLIPLLLLFEYFLIIPNVLLLIAIYFGILITEDFSWFLFNWHFNALRELLKGPHGNIWWHKRWFKLFKGYYLPFSYFIPLPIIIFLLLIS